MSYKQIKSNFLDNLQPDDFRNGGSFNQAEIIIDSLSEALKRAVASKEDPQKFIQKAVSNLFRDGSLAQQKAAELLNIYLNENK